MVGINQSQDKGLPTSYKIVKFQTSEETHALAAAAAAVVVGFSLFNHKISFHC
jgi:hypothetical protein